MGPIEGLCEEIGFKFDPRMERQDLLVAFVRELVEEVRHMRWVASAVVKVGGKPPSDGSGEALALADEMLAGRSREEIIARATVLHDACWRLNPDDAYPTDHLIDMLSSCASALRFGLELPCRSRHAAAAASDVWRQRYGVSLFDGCTGAWEHDWARQKLTSALIALLPPPPDQQVSGAGSREGHESEPDRALIAKENEHG